MATCKQCNTGFEITDEDRKFLDKVSPIIGGKKFTIPEPTMCPNCRDQRRLTFRNERVLYRRICDLSGKKIISIYSQDKPVKAYEKNEWYSDKWDAMEYGRDFDFNRPFFEQFGELDLEVPKMALLVDGSINSDYTNQSGWDKNCYLCFCSDHNEDCYFCQDVYYSKDAVDALFCYNIENGYECVDCKDSFSLFYSQNTTNGSDSWYLYDCINCQNCFGCAGLRNKRFHFLNEPLSEEGYKKRLNEFHQLSGAQQLPIKKKIEELIEAHPRKAFVGQNNENVVGDYLFNSKNAYHCFDSIDLEDSRYCTNIKGGKNCMDISRWGHPAEVCYDCSAIGEGAFRILFSSACWGNSSDSMYVSECISINNCFGCVGLRHKKYCILNKQYPKEEYEILVPKIIEHMKSTGEWGKFFPAHLSPFAYNETGAQQYYPIQKEEAIKSGWKWFENKEVEATAESHSSATACEECEKNFKIVEQENSFYKRNHLSKPTACPECRNKRRLARRNPRKLWDRKCDKCGVDIRTSFAPDRPEIVYCEACYLKEVY